MRLEIISNSSERDNFARQLVLDYVLVPMEKAQHEIQKAAKHAQELSGKIVDHHKDHGMTLEDAQETERQLKLIAVRLSNVISINDLRVDYAAITEYRSQISVFRNKYENCRIEYSIRKGILDRLNDSMAVANNTQMRLDLSNLSQELISRVEPIVKPALPKRKSKKNIQSN